MRRLRLLALLALLPGSPLAAAAAAPPARVSEGSHLYGQYCLACHGAGGRGVGRPVPAGAGAGPLRLQTQQARLGPSLRGVGALAADFYLTTGYMPLSRLGVQPRRSRVLFSPAQVEALVAYVASLAPGPPVPIPDPARGNLAQGLHLFTDHCAGCHQVAAEGGYVTGALPPPLHADSPLQIAEAVRIGPFVMPRFSERALSDSQLDSIIAYIDYVKHPANPGGFGLGYIGPVPEGLVTWLVAAAACLAFCVVIGKRLQQA